MKSAILDTKKQTTKPIIPIAIGTCVYSALLALTKTVTSKMKTKLTLILLLLLSFYKMNACSCDTPKPIIELQSAQYVFEGKVISKIYSSDSLNYTIKFKILKHYKNGDKPQFLEFTFPAEERYTGEWTSCDWSIDVNENWLVYTKYWKDKLKFGYFCTNSKPLNSRIISQNEQQILDNANEFSIDKYILNDFDGFFTQSKPEKDLDLILEKYHNKDYGNKNKAHIVVDIDKNGNLLAANVYSLEEMRPKNNLIIDTIFRLNKPPNIESNKVKTEFEKDILNIVRTLKKWDIICIDDTEIAVNKRLVLQFYKKENNIEVYY